jgi:hypothetical protein
VDAEDPLAEVQRALAERFEQQPARASVSFVGVEPIEVLRFEVSPDLRTYVSLGMSRHPMTGAQEQVRQSSGPRAELVLEIRDPADAFRDVWRQLAVLAAAPAVEGVVYREAMTVDLGAALVSGSGCTGVVAADSALPAVPTAAGEVDFVRVVPATSAEIAWCRVRGAAALREQWRAAGTDLLDLARRPVQLG